MKTLPLFVFYTTTISFEQVFGSLLPIPFSRSTADLKRSPGKLIEILRGRLAASRIDSYDFTSVVGNERGKGRYVSGLRLVYSDAGGNRTTRDLVVKYLSARNEPLLLSSLKCAVERGMNREVEFYRRLAAEIPFVTPECLVAEWIPTLYRGILVLERIFPDSQVQDHVGCTPDQSATVLDNIARMHARFWNRLADGPSTRWLLDRHPLDCYWFLKYISWRERACRSLWRALYRHFAAHPRTLTHGDCRPGNILWVKAGSVAMLDWQFVHGGIGTWDASYYLVMSHEVDIRRRNEDELLGRYHTRLSNAYQEFFSAGLPYSEQQCRLDAQVLKLVLGLYGWAALVSHMFDRYGNDPRDVRGWADRITFAIEDLDSGLLSSRIGVKGSVIDEFKSIMSRARQETLKRFSGGEAG